MLKDKKGLEQYLEKEFISIILDDNKCKEIYNYTKDKYNMPKGFTSDLLSLRKPLSETSEFVLFCLLDAFNQVTGKKAASLDKYFTMQEVQTYRKSQYEVNRIKFPLIFKMIEISDNQWIGKISISRLMELRKAQLINYNVNAQRTMQRVVKGDKSIYKIALNWKAIEQIEKAYQSHQFIPNTLTLNIPINTENDFYYDADSCSLIIKSLEYFDISDGYHRYIAACQRKDKDSEFDYEMELRIVNFSDDKAKQFIFQEDQKTKMRKIDSDSFNLNKAANIVATRMNEDLRCNLQGLISRNDGLIPFGEFAEIIDYFYFKDVNGKEKEKLAIIHATRELIDMFNALTEYDSKYLTEKYSFKLLTVIVYCFTVYTDNKSQDEICKIIDKMMNVLNATENKKFYTKKIRKSLINDLDSIAKECEM